MAAPVVVVEERRIAAPVEVVWALATDPAHHELLSPKCRLVSATGGPGAPGSETVDEVRVAFLRFRLRSRVVTATPEEAITVECWRGRRAAGVQTGELLPDGDGVLLRWTVSIPDGGLWPRRVEQACRAELVRWLGAIEREALAG